MEKICPICERHCQMTALSCKRGETHFSSEQLGQGYHEQHKIQEDQGGEHQGHQKHQACYGYQQNYDNGKHLSFQRGYRRHGHQLCTGEHSKMLNQECQERFNFHEHLRRYRYHQLVAGASSAL